jgi:hypothetical protein
MRRCAAWITGACLLATGVMGAEKKETPLENWITFGYGYTLQSGDRPGFQKAFQLNKDGYGGIEDLFYTSAIDDTTTLKLRGRALAGNHDYLLDLSVTRDEVGYLKVGYKQYRTFFDGSGGVWPATGRRFGLYDEDLGVDRGNFWFELGTAKPAGINSKLRYDYTTRDGEKDSTSWMDSGLPPFTAATTRYIVPTFLRFDEKRHTLVGTFGEKTEKRAWSLGVRYDKGEYDNARYSRRRPFETTTDRFVTAREGQDYDLLQFRGSYLTDISEKVKVTTSASRTKIDTVLSGSRIFGAGYDAAYTNNYPTRQQRDEGYFAAPGHANLGESEMVQTIANIQGMIRPNEHWVLIPGLRFEKTEWENLIEFEETNFGAGPAFAPINDEVEAGSEKHWKTWSGSFEARYTGIKNFALNFKADMMNSEGRLVEDRILEPGTPLQAISIDRDTNLERETQKVAFTGNWYPRAGTTLAIQWFFRARQNGYRSTRDNTVSTADRYPAYIANQDFETNDFNLRLSHRFAPNFRSVTRYDYQKTEVRTQDVGLGFKQSAEQTQHILAESITWNPVNRWFLQANLNIVYDTLKTPAVGLTGAAANLVKNSDANYYNFSLSSGYALDDSSDLFCDFGVYESHDSYVDNSAVTVPYGSESKLTQFGVTWTRRLNRNTTVSARYAYAENEDVPQVGFADYDAHLFYAKLQYRF